MASPPFISFLIILLYLSCSLIAQRVDQVQVIQTPLTGTQGNWLSPLYCPDGSYANGYKQFIETKTGGFLFDDLGLLLVELTCVNILSPTTISTIKHSTTVSSSTTLWSSQASCSDSNIYLNGFNLKYGTSSIAATGIKFLCLNGVEVEATLTMNDGTWRGVTTCPTGSAVCGIQIMFDENMGAFEDDSGLNDVKIFCCGICDFNTRFFDLTTKKCLLCHYSCNTCSGPLANNCLSCYFGDTLGADNRCPSPASTLLYKENPF